MLHGFSTLCIDGLGKSIYIEHAVFLDILVILLLLGYTGRNGFPRLSWLS
jgi:hypothetical protein